MQVLWNPTREILKKHTLEVNPIPHGGSCRNVPPYQEIVYLDFVITQVFIVQLGLSLS